MMNKKKNFTSFEQVDNFANKYVGKKFKEFLNLEDFNKRNKGQIGLFIEEQLFEIPSNNLSKPDFEVHHLKLELKVTPIKKLKGKNQYSAKERLVLSMINYSQIAKEDFYHSHFFNKFEKIQIINYLDDPDINLSDWEIKSAYQIDWNQLPQDELKTIKKDYEIIQKKVLEGKAHEISESDTLILSACRKGAGKGKDLRQQPFSQQKANSRAFALKPSYMTTLFYRFFKQDSNSNTKNEKSAQQYLNEIINYIDTKLTGTNVYNFFHQNMKRTTNPKNMGNLVIQELLKEYDINYKSILAKFGYKIKAMTVNEKGKVQESFDISNSLDNTDMQDENYTFEDSEVYQQLVLTKYIIIPIKKIKKDLSTLTIEQSFEFFIDENNQQIIETLKNVWLKTKECFMNPEPMIQKKKIDKNGKEYYLINFPRAGENLGFHIRPKARNNTNRYLIGGGKYSIVKPTFWVNKNIIDNYHLKNK